MLVYSKLLNEKNIGDERGLMEFCSSAKGSYGFDSEFLQHICISYVEVSSLLF